MQLEYNNHMIESLRKDYLEIIESYFLDNAIRLDYSITTAMKEYCWLSFLYTKQLNEKMILISIFLILYEV
jgi:hypothetical protein